VASIRVYIARCTQRNSLDDSSARNEHSSAVDVAIARAYRGSVIFDALLHRAAESLRFAAGE
jgi:hypothetical protein